MQKRDGSKIIFIIGLIIMIFLLSKGFYSGTPDPSNPDHYYGPRIIPPSGNQDDAPEINPLGIPPDPTVICSDYGSPVICGDGVINQWWEKCDPPDMGMCAPGTCIPPNQPGECTCPLNNTVQFPENPPK